MNDVCPNGHEWTPENTYTNTKGVRFCRTCRREAMRRIRAQATERMDRTRCKNGHPRQIVDGQPVKRCRECHREQNKRYRDRQREKLGKPKRKMDRTRCKNGHPRQIVDGQPVKRCRECHREQNKRFRSVLSDAHAQLARRIDAHEQGGQSVPCRVSVFPSWWMSDDPDERAAAARACADCPVLADCKAAATDSKERFGVWGGKDFTHKPGHPKPIDPDDITEGMHVERRDALTDTHGVLQVAAEYGDDHGTCEATLTATQCYSAPLTGPVGFWENAEALADHIERGA